MRLPQISFQFSSPPNAQPNPWPFQEWAMASATEEPTQSLYWQQQATPPIPTYNPVPAQWIYWSNEAYNRQDHPINHQNNVAFSNVQNTTWYQTGWSTHTSQPESSGAIRAFHRNMHTGAANMSSPGLEQHIHSDTHTLRPGHHTGLIPDDHTNTWHVDRDMLQPGKCEAVALDSEYFAHQTHAINASSCRTHLATTDHSQQPWPSSTTAEGDVTYAGVEPVEDRYPPATFDQPINHHQGRGSLDWSTFEIAKALETGEGQPATDGPDQRTKSREVKKKQTHLSRLVLETSVGTDSEDNVLVERKADLPRQPNGREQTEATEAASDSTASCSASEPTTTNPSPTTLQTEVKRKHDKVDSPSLTNSASATPISSYDGTEPTSSQSSASTSRRPRKVNKTSHRKALKTKRGPRTPKAHQEIISGAKDEFTMFWVDPSCGKMGNPPIIHEDGLPRQTKRRRMAV